MKKIILVFVCFALAFLNACTKGCREKTPAKCVLRIGTNPNFPPYETTDSKGELVGFDIDVGRALAQKLNCDAVFKEFDFDALILALNKEQIDIILSGMSITESRQKEIAMVAYQGEPITEISFLFWQSIPEPIHSFADLKRVSLEKNLPVSVQAGHFLEEFLKAEEIPLKPLPGPPEQILEIKYKKSLAAAVDNSNAKSVAKEHSDLKVITLPLPKDKWDLGNGIGIKKSRKDLIEKITQAVEELDLKSLKEKWLKGGQ